MLQSQVIDLAEDGNGFIWISSGTGLQRFDGKKFLTITVRNDNKGLTDDKDVHLFKLQNGNLWLTNNQGITEYNYSTNTFRRVYKINAGESDISAAAYEDDAGVWCFFQNKGLIYLDKKNFSLKEKILFVTHINPERTATKEMITVAGNKIIVKLSGNAIVFDLNTKTARLWKPDAVQGFFHSFEKLSDDTLLVVSDKKIEKINITTLKSGEEFPLPCSNQTRELGIHIRKIKKDLFIISCGTELYELDTKQNKYVAQLVNLQNQSFLNIGFAKAILTDGLNNLWLLSVNDGLRKINYNFSGFRYFGTADKKNNFIKTIYVDKQANLVFCGTYNSGLLLFDTTQQLIKHIRSFPGRIAPTVVAIQKKDDNHYFVYLENGWDVLLLNTQNFSLQKLKVNVTKFINHPPDYYSSILNLSDSLTVLHTSNALYRVITSSSTKLRFTLIDTFKTSAICAYVDHDKNVWIGSAGKYFFLSADHLSLLKEFTLEGKILCRSFLQDHSGRMWMATEKGLFLLNSAGEVKRIYLKKDGLADEGIYAIQEDKQGNIWFSHNKGITRMSAAGSFLHFSKNDGLQENEFNTNTSFQTKDGEIFFGGVNGISSFYPDAINNLSESPKLLLTDIKIKDLQWREDTAYWSIEKIELPSKNNIVSFEFSAIGLRNPDQYNYQYRMSGVDADWVNAGNDPNVKYNLSPGSYTFYYYAGNTFNSSPKNYKQLGLIIHPPFWRTWWFITASIMLIIAFVFAIAFLITRQRFNKKKKALQVQQELQNDRERISRELHDNIGAQLSFISSNIDWIIDRANIGEEDETKRLKLVNETTKNVMANLRETIWALNKEEIKLDEFADKLKLYILNMLRLRPEIELKMQENIQHNTSLASTEALNLFRICQECINNVMKHARATMLNVTIYSKPDQFYRILIEDNGQGFTKTEQINGHYGLENISFRANELNAQLSVDTKPGKGTRIEIYKYHK